MDGKKEELMTRIQELKKSRQAVILAHNYQIGEVQDAADFVGDSFELSRTAANLDAAVIVFCGVTFMAETAAVLAPDKIVLLPETMAGCPMADMATVDEVRRKRAEHPGAAVVTYVNTSAAVKAESDICVTSSNALNVVNSLDAEEILFIPDKNLGGNIASQTDKRIILWDGYCPAHDNISIQDVAAAREAHPDAVVIVHPECRREVVKAADYALSTGAMIKFARETKHEKIIVGTEMGMLYRLEKENPHKTFYLLSEKLICPTMKMTNLEKVCIALETMQTRVTVPAPINDLARIPLERMLSVV